MGDGISDLKKRGLPWGPGPCRDGNCDACGRPLPDKGVVSALDWRYHIRCAPSWFWRDEETKVKFYEKYKH